MTLLTTTDNGKIKIRDVRAEAFDAMFPEHAKDRKGFVCWYAEEMTGSKKKG